MANLKRELFEFYLVMVTVLLFSSLGIIFLVSTFYSWYMSLNYPYWTNTPVYLEYVRSLNVIAFSLTLILIITLFFCLEKRVLRIREGVLVTIFSLLSGFLFWILNGVSQAIVASMSVIFLFYLYLLIKLLVGKDIRSEKMHILEKSGSLVLHASYALIVMSVGGLNEHPLQIPFFWAGTIFCLAGKMLSFYGRSTVKCFKRFFSLSQS